MAFASYEPSQWAFRSHTRQIARDKPSPLRIFKRRSTIDWEDASESTDSEGGARSDLECQQRGGLLTARNCSQARDHPRSYSGDHTDDFDGLNQANLSRRHRYGTVNELQGHAGKENPPLPQGSSTAPPLKVSKVRQRGIQPRSHLELRETWCGPRSSGFSPRGDQDCAPKRARASIYNLPELGRHSVPFFAGGRDMSLPRTVSPGTLRQPLQACVLVPHVVITPEVTALETGSRAFWVAIEISGQISRVPAGKDSIRLDEPADAVASPVFNNSDQQEGLFDFGCLYDLSVEALPLTGTTIIRVLKEQLFPTSTICARAGTLLLAQVRVDVQQAPHAKRSGHVRHKSDDLFEDLEVELGDSQVSYMQIRISYSHSAFPWLTNTETPNGVSSIQSRVETVATATLKVHNTLSPWSPAPAPSSNPLFRLVERHWGTAKATELMQLTVDECSTPKRPAKAQLRSEVSNLDNLLGPQRAALAAHVGPVVPVRQASLQGANLITQPNLTCTRGSADEMRQKAVGGGTPASTMGGRASLTSGSSSHGPPWPSRDPPSPAATVGEQDQISSLFKRSPFGTGALGSLVPTLADRSTSCRQRKLSSSKSVREGGGRAKVVKRDTRWSWAGWF